MPSLLPGESDSNPGSTLIDESVIVAFLLGALHSDTIGNLVYWTEGELIQWIDAAVKRLARQCGIFAGRDITNSTANGQATYALPGQHLATLHISNGTAPLRPTSVAELSARDASFATTPGTPARWYQDLLGMATYGLAPVPTAIAVLAVIYQGWPQTVDAAKVHTTIPLPWLLEGFIELYVISQAYSKEGDAHAPDIAADAVQMMAVYEAAARQYWGPAA